jgi:hypothetical protein
VAVDYTVTTTAPSFRQTATILTNDVDRPRIELAITGAVRLAYRVVPSSVVLEQVSANESTTAQVRVLSSVSDSLAITGFELMEESNAEYFDVTVTKLPRDELDDPHATSGCLVSITVKHGMPAGRIEQELQLRTNLAQATVIRVPIEGNVNNDISVSGKGWYDEKRLLRLGVIDAREGVKTKLMIFLRGPHRLETKLEVGAVVPDTLKVTLDERMDTFSAAIVPLVIEVPAGSAPVNHLGKKLGQFGKITVETTHPQIKEVPIYVEFAVSK